MCAIVVDHAQAVERLLDGDRREEHLLRRTTLHKEREHESDGGGGASEGEARLLA